MEVVVSGTLQIEDQAARTLAQEAKDLAEANGTAIDVTGITALEALSASAYTALTAAQKPATKLFFLVG